MDKYERKELMEDEVEQISAGLEMDIMKLYELVSNYGDAENALRNIRDHVGETVLTKIRDNWDTINSSERIPDQVKSIVARYII